MVLDTFKSPSYINYIDSNTISAGIPPGLMPDIYNLHITNPASEYIMIPNHFTIYEEFTPDIFVSSKSYEFGALNIGGTKTYTFTVMNEGEKKLEIHSIILMGTDTSEFHIYSNNCVEQSIAHLDSCTFDVTFSPLTEGKKNVSVKIESDDPDENPVIISLSGSAGPEINIKWNNIPIPNDNNNISINNGTNFGVFYKKDETITRTFTIENLGVKRFKLETIGVGSCVVVSTGDKMGDHNGHKTL